MADMLLPKNGDVVVSNRHGTMEPELAIVPARPHMICVTQGEAVAWARGMAREQHVDAWLTEDLTHFLRIASHRS